MHWMMPQRMDSAVTWRDWQHKQKQPKTPQTTKSLRFNVAEQGTGKNEKIDTSARRTFNKANTEWYQRHWDSRSCFLYASLYWERVTNSLRTWKPSDSNTFWSLITDPDWIWAVEPEESVSGKTHFVLTWS